jgi:hypothetical protein
LFLKYLHVIASLFGIPSSDLNLESKTSLTEEMICQSLMESDEVQGDDPSSDRFVPGVFDSIIFHTNYEPPIKKLKDLTWPILVEEQRGLSDSFNSSTHIFLLDFRDVIFLGSWELIDDFLQPWGSFKVDQILKTISKVPIWKIHYADVILGRMICSSIVDSCFSRLSEMFPDFYYLDSMAFLQGTSPLLPNPHGGSLVMAKDPKLPGQLKMVKIEAYRKVFIPANFYSRHWNLYVVDFECQTITSFDSLDNENMHTSMEIEKIIQFWMNGNSGNFTHRKGRCQSQIQGSLDCAAHVIVNAQNLSQEGAEQFITQHNFNSSNEIRKAILELLKG